MHDRDLSILVGMSQRLESGQQLPAGLRQVTDAALQLLAADHASLRVCDERAGELRVAARSGIGVERRPLPFRLGEGLMGWVARTGRSARVADSHRDPRFRPSGDRGYPVSSLMSLPLRSAERVHGVLSVSSPSRNAFDVHDEQLLRLLSHCAAQALQLDALRTQVITDSHTGAFNRSYLGPRLDQEMSRALRSGEDLSLLLHDLDDFKRVNDSYGHRVGDEVLRGFVDILRQSVRGGDVVVRRGGDEFVLILPATSPREALQIAGRIGREFMQARSWGDAQVTFAQTVSMGVATWDGSEAPGALEGRADQAMYAAKHGGRNRVVASERSRERPRPTTRQLELWASPPAPEP